MGKKTGGFQYCQVWQFWKKINNMSSYVLLISLWYRYEVQGLALLSTYSIYELRS